MGGMYTQVLLQDRLTLSMVREEAACWGNDMHATFDSATATAYVWSTRWDTPTDADQFAYAFADERPGNRSTVTVRQLAVDIVIATLGPMAFFTEMALLRERIICSEW